MMHLPDNITLAHTNDFDITLLSPLSTQVRWRNN